MKMDLSNLMEVNNCLALATIANIGGREMAEALYPDVYRLLVSESSVPFSFVFFSFFFFFPFCFFFFLMVN
jgi:hypothetical protein